MGVVSGNGVSTFFKTRNPLIINIIKEAKTTPNLQ